MKNKKLTLTKLLFIFTVLVVNYTNSVFAQHPGRHHWHGGNIHHFEAHDRIIWNGGQWRHARYAGRFGWYWVVGPSWYYYPSPIYPYPDPYRPPTIVIEKNTTPTSPPAQSWYFCSDTNEYYPYVSTCSSGWKAVPVTPPDVTNPPPQK